MKSAGLKEVREGTTGLEEWKREGSPRIEKGVGKEEKEGGQKEQIPPCFPRLSRVSLFS
jgi:hypothetical protein